MALKSKIGTNAGLVWSALTEGKKTAKELKKSTKLVDKDLYAAFGWLAREEKINLVETETDVEVELV